MAEILEGVEAPKEGEIAYKRAIELLKKRNLNEMELSLISELINGRNITDVSGYSGITTLLVKATSKDPDGYCIKIADELHSLKKEAVMADFFSKNGYTTPVVEHLKGNQEILVTRQINSLLALSKYIDIRSLATFMGKSLRNFHDNHWDFSNLTANEKEILFNNSERIITSALSHVQGLQYIADYQKDHNYEEMKKYIKENLGLYQKDEVIIHGDYNPRNVFVKNDNTSYVVDFADSGLGDRHYDIYWTMWTISLYLFVQADPKLVQECETIFLNSYGRDVIDENRLNFCKKLNCMYWQENNSIHYLDK